VGSETSLSSIWKLHRGPCRPMPASPSATVEAHSVHAWRSPDSRFRQEECQGLEREGRTKTRRAGFRRIVQNGDGFEIRLPAGWIRASV